MARTTYPWRRKRNTSSTHTRPADQSKTVSSKEFELAPASITRPHTHKETKLNLDSGVVTCSASKDSHKHQRWLLKKKPIVHVRLCCRKVDFFRAFVSAERDRERTGRTRALSSHEQTAMTFLPQETRPAAFTLYVHAS